MLNIEACHIGRYGGGKMCGSPIPGLHRVKLNVEAVGEHMKVQKRSHSLSDWTLERREACGSPKRKPQSARLDVRVAVGMQEVQKGSSACRIGR